MASLRRLGVAWGWVGLGLEHGQPDSWSLASFEYDMEMERHWAKPRASAICTCVEQSMILVSASDLGRQYSGDPIFTGLRFEIRAGERIGLVGPNGAGKTTLMKLLAREDQPEYGHLHVRPGVRVSLLRQHPQITVDETLMEVARSGLGSLLELQQEMEEAAREI